MQGRRRRRRARSRSGARRTSPKGGPDGGDGGKGGDIWLQADRNVASLLAFRDHPHRKAKSGTHGSGQPAPRRAAARTSSCTSPRAPSSGTTRPARSSPTWSTTATRWLAARGGRGGRGNARFLSNAAPGAELRRAGRVRRGRVAATSSCSSWPTPRSSGSPTPGKSTLISADQRGQAQDRRLPVHHARAEPRRRAVPGPRVRASPTSPASSRARPRAGARPPVPPPRRAGPRARGAARPRAGRRAQRPRSRSGPARRAAAATGPSCSTGPGSSSAPRPTSPTHRVRRPAHLRRRRTQGLDRARSAGSARSIDEARDGRARARRRSSCYRPEEEGFVVERDDDGAWRVSGRVGRAGRRGRRPHQRGGARLRAGPVPAHGRREGAAPRPARRRATSCGSARSSSSTSRGHLSVPMLAVVKIGTSSITDAVGRDRRRRAAQALRRAGRARAARATRCCSCARARSPPGCPPSGSPQRPDRHRDAAGRRRGRPAAG